MENETNNQSDTHRNKPSRSFGSIREFKGRKYPFYASYPIDKTRNSRRTGKSFRLITDARKWLSKKEVEFMGGDDINPDKGKITLAQYAELWLSQLSVEQRTRETYEGQMRHLFGPPPARRKKGVPALSPQSTRPHGLPYLGNVQIKKLTAPQIKAWRVQSWSDGASEHTTTRAYQRLQAMMNTAVNDKYIAESPCTIKGAATETHPERPIAGVRVIMDAHDAMTARLAISVHLAAWCQMRKGEMFALRRFDIDADDALIHVTRAAGYPKRGKRKDPKGHKGRYIPIPRVILPALKLHLEMFVGDAPDSPILTGVRGGPIRPGTLQDAWSEARASIGRQDLHMHDLRHSGATLLARTPGATVSEIKERLGHNSERAAYIYQHAADQMNSSLGDDLSDLIEREGRMVSPRKTRVPRNRVSRRRTRSSFTN